MSDDLKFYASTTLFDAIAPNDIFATALQKYFANERDAATLAKLSV